MFNRYVIVFLLLSTIFTFVHWFASMTSLYWYYWWFDIIMHFSGGVLIALGIRAFCDFSFIRLRPTFTLLVIVLILATSSWELFEWYNGLWFDQGYIFDTIKDIIMGFSGGLLTHYILNKYTIES
jgi:hypothetical protein